VETVEGHILAAEDALRRAAQWFAAQGYVRPRVAARVLRAA